MLQDPPWEPCDIYGDCANSANKIHEMVFTLPSGERFETNEL